MGSSRRPSAGPPACYVAVDQIRGRRAGGSPDRPHRATSEGWPAPVENNAGKRCPSSHPVPSRLVAPNAQSRGCEGMVNLMIGGCFHLADYHEPIAATPPTDSPRTDLLSADDSSHPSEAAGLRSCPRSTALPHFEPRHLGAATSPARCSPERRTSSTATPIPFLLRNPPEQTTRDPTRPAESRCLRRVSVSSMAHSGRCWPRDSASSEPLPLFHQGWNTVPVPPP